MMLTLPDDLRLAPGAKDKDVTARLNRKGLAASRIRPHGTRRIEVRAPRAGTLSVALDRRSVELSRTGRRRRDDATTADLDFSATIRSGGADQERVVVARAQEAVHRAR